MESALLHVLVPAMTGLILQPHKGQGQDGGYSVPSHIMHRVGEGVSSGG